MISKRAALGALILIAASTSADAAVTISTASTQNMICSGGTCVPTAAKAVLNASDLENDLSQFGNVRVMTTGSGVEANNIIVNAAFTSPDSTSLTLEAHKAITVNAVVSIGSGTAELELQSDKRSESGTLSFGGKGRITFGSLSDIFGINGVIFTLVGSVQGFAAAVAANPSGAFALANSYDAKGDGTYSFPPILYLYGIVEGLGNAISNLSINDTEIHDDVALIGTLESGGSVSNLSLRRARVYGVSCYCGILAGYNGGTVFSESISGTIKGVGEGSTGAIVGKNGTEATIQNSHTSATVIGGDYSDVGGLAGENDGTIKDSFATGNVKPEYGDGQGNNTVGGFVGVNKGTIEQSFATGTISRLYESWSGGLVGSNSGTVANSYSSGDNSGMHDYYSGGLIGINHGTVQRSYSTAAVTGATFIGGLVGGDFSTSGSIADTYWDTDTSGITDPSQGAGNIANDPGITGLTTQQFQSGLPTGFDPKIWAEKSTINNGLPYLIANPPPK